MKKVLMGTVMLFAILTSYSQTITVRSQQAEDIDFTKFKTFYWASNISSKDDQGMNFLGDLVLKAMVMDAVKGELEGLGYQEQQQDPDMIVNFRVFDKKATLRGMEGYGDNYWGGSNYASMNDQSTEVEAGTLLLSLVDRESGAIVWNGFASGLIENDTFIKDEGKIQEAVNLIFEEYNQRAKEYSRR